MLVSEVSIRDRFGSLALGWRTRSRTRGKRAGTSTGQRLWPVLPVVVVQVLVALDLDLPLVRPVLALVGLLGVPTLVLARRARIASDSVSGRVLYAFGASLLAVILVALVLNTVLPVVGVDQPLQPTVLALAWLAIDVGLVAWRTDVPLVPALSWSRTTRRVLDARFEPAPTLATGSLLLAVVGAVRLNNGAGGTVALLAEVLAAAALVVLAVRPAVTLGRDVGVLALVAAGLLLGTSLRGWSITGHDIQAEWLSFQLTNDNQHWQMSALQNAYNACLSVNILPTVLAQVTGLSGVVVFKVLLQLVFALVPATTYLLSRRFLSRRLALAAATFTMAFPTFFTDMPYLVRQEMAFFFLALLLLAATEPTAPHRRQLVAVAVLGVGVVLSHYSTTYVMLMGLVFALLAMGALRLLGRWWSRFEHSGDGASRLVLLNPLVVAFLVVASLAWAGPVTHTGAHATDVARETVSALTGHGSKTPASSDASYRLFSRDRTTPRERLDDYVKQTMTYRRDNIAPRDLLVRHPHRAELRPAIAHVGKAPPTAFGHFLYDLGIAPGHVNAAAKVLCAVLMQVFLLAGLLWLVWRRRRTDDDAPRPSRELVLLSYGAVAALGLIVLVPNLSVDYGVLRAFQQTMLVTAPVMAAGMWLLIRPLGSRLASLAVVVPVVLLLVLTGVLPALLGGNQPRLALSNSGGYYDRFYTSDSESQAIDWLAVTDASTSWRSKIIANRNVTVKMLAASRNAAPVADRLYPTLLTRDAYVYADSQIVEQGRSTLFHTGDLISYVYPTKDLDRRLDLVYSSPRTRIYR